jgi:branched-chain amino acid transport system permease protein
MPTATPTPTPNPDAASEVHGSASGAASTAEPAAGADLAAGDALARLRPAGWTAAPRAVWPLVAGVVIAFLVHALLRPALGGFGVVLAIAGINIILAVSLNIVNGYAGQFSIGHAGFMAVGAYAGAAIVYYASFKIWGDGGFHGGSLSYIGRDEPEFWPPVQSGEWLFLAACLAAGLVAAAAGWVVGLPSLRLRGDYLAIVTLGFGEIVRVVLQGTDAQLPGRRPADVQVIRDTPFWRLLDNLGGSRSFSSVPPYATVFWIFVWVAIVLAVAVRLKYSGYGRALLSIREDEIAARAVGVNVTRYKVRAFVLSAFFAGVAGALTALHVGQINAGELGFQRSFEIVIMVVLGGLGSVSGAAMAAVLLTVLPELLRSPPSLWPWGVPVVVVVAALVWFRARRPVRGLVALASVCAAYELVRYGAGALGVDLAQYRMIFYSLVLIFVMILRPQGLLGVAELWDLWPLNLLPGLRRGRLVSAAVGAGSRKTSPAEGRR